MNNWPDGKIQKVALRYIKQSSMDTEDWRFTRVGTLHDSLVDHLVLEDGELPIVSNFLSSASWYCFTTRRIIGVFNARHVDNPATGLRRADFGDFKGFRNTETEIMTLDFNDGTQAQLEFETGKASMAPIYAERFWLIKFPVLDNLKG